MISPDLAPTAPGPVQARSGARPAERPAPERAFAEFLQGVAADASETGVEEPELMVVLDAPLVTSAPEAEAPDAAAPAPFVAALSIPVALLPTAGVGEPAAVADGDARAASGPDVARPLSPPATVAEAPVTEALGAKVTTPVVGLVALEGGDTSPTEAEREGEAEHEGAARIPSLSPVPGAAQGPSGGDARPIAAAAAAAFDLALQPASAQSWRLSAASAEALPAREPAPAPSPRDVAGQITVAIAQATQPQVEIRLDPPELGRVQIRLTPTETGLQAVVLAERPETQEFLRRHADALVRDLTDAGYAQVSLDFAAGGEAAPRDAPADERGPSQTFAASAAPVPPRAAPAPVAAGGLDIRL